MLRRTLKHIPNTLTFSNMLCGLHAILLQLVYPKGEKLELACLFIFLAVSLDAFDGKLARLLDAESILGKQMDSFADFTSFGIAPMVLLLAHDEIRHSGFVLYICIMVYISCGAFRLARFNVGDYSECFVGLPITAAGFMFACINLLLQHTSILQHQISLPLLAIVLLLLAGLMASTYAVPRIEGLRHYFTNKQV